MTNEHGLVLQSQQEVFGDGRNMVQMSKAELAMRSEDLSVMTGWKGGKDRRGKATNRVSLCATATQHQSSRLIHVSHSVLNCTMSFAKMYLRTGTYMYGLFSDVL